MWLASDGQLGEQLGYCESEENFLPPLSGYDLSGFDLSLAQLWSHNLRGSNLEGAWLIGACLDGAVFDGCNMIGARCEGALMEEASFVGARYTGNTFRDADVRGGIWVNDWKSSLNKDYGMTAAGLYRVERSTPIPEREADFERHMKAMKKYWRHAKEQAQAGLKAAASRPDGTEGISELR